MLLARISCLHSVSSAMNVSCSGPKCNVRFVSYGFEIPSGTESLLKGINTFMLQANTQLTKWREIKKL